jgi:hypothetical protein
VLSFSFDVEIEFKERMIVIYLNCFLHILRGLGGNTLLSYRSGGSGAFVYLYIMNHKCAKNATPKDWVKGKGREADEWDVPPPFLYREV